MRAARSMHVAAVPAASPACQSTGTVSRDTCAIMCTVHRSATLGDLHRSPASQASINIRVAITPLAT